MDFIEKLRKELKFDSKADLAKKLGKTLQAYYSLELATDRITLRDLVALRHIEGMTDQKLLDLIEEEAQLGPRPSKRKSNKANRNSVPTPSQTPKS